VVCGSQVLLVLRKDKVLRVFPTRCVGLKLQVLLALRRDKVLQMLRTCCVGLKCNKCYECYERIKCNKCYPRGVWVSNITSVTSDAKG
jgi:hypothetical protein